MLLGWLAEKPHWCISRELWGGHPIPGWQITVRADRDQTESGGVTASLNRVQKEFAIAVTEFAKACGIDQDVAIARGENPTSVFICSRSERADTEIRGFYKRHHRARNVARGG